MTLLEIFAVAVALTLSFVLCATVVAKIAITTVEKVSEAVTAPFLTSPAIEQPAQPVAVTPTVFTPPWEDPWNVGDAEDPIDLDLDV